MTNARIREPWKCWKCQGSLKAETTPTEGGVLVQFMCLQCRRVWPAGVKPRSSIAA